MARAAHFYVFFWMTTLTLPNEDGQQSENVLPRSSFVLFKSPWQLEGFAEFGWTVINSLSGSAIKTVKYPGIDNSLVNVVLENYVARSPGLLAFIVLCSIITFVLILGVCMVYVIYQQHDTSNAPTDAPSSKIKRWWILFPLLCTIIFCLFGACAYLLGAHQASAHLPVGFQLADRVIDTSYTLKTSFLKDLNDVSQETPLVSNSLLSTLDLKGYVIAEFLRTSEPYTSPIITAAFDADINLDRLLFSLMDMKTDIIHLMNDSISNLNKDILIFNGISDTIKYDARRLSAFPAKEKLMELEKLPEVEIDFDEVERQFEGHLKILENITSRDVFLQTVGLENSLSKAVEDVNIDFSAMLKGIKNSIFQTEDKLRENKNVILSGANTLYSEKVKNDLMTTVNQFRYLIESHYLEVSSGLIAIGALSVIMILPFLVGLIFCFVGTDCLTKLPSASKLQWLQIGIKTLWG